MATLEELRASMPRNSVGCVPPPGTITLEPDQFASTWSKRPVVPVVFGLRLISEAEIETAHTQAERVARGSVELYNRELLTLCVSRCLCDPHDVSAPHPFLPLPEDMVPRAFPARTITRIFDEYERLLVQQSPLFREASEEDLAALRDALVDGIEAFAEVDRVQALRARRYLALALDILSGE